MAKDRSRVKIEYPQGSETHYGKEVTVKTRHEKPEITVGGGGGDISGGDIIGTLFIGVILLLVGIGYCIYVVDYAVETYVIKSINPNYKTSFEIAEEKREKRKAEEQRKKEEADRIEAIKPENIKEWNMERAKSILSAERRKFWPFDCCSVGNNVWVSGNLVFSKKDYRCYPVVVISEDGGNKYRLLSHLDIQTHPTHSSQIAFSDNVTGVWAVNRGLSSVEVYRTKDSGKTWKMILSTDNMKKVCGCTVREIVTSGSQRIIADLSFGSVETLKSHDGGKSWTYFSNEEAIAWTCDGGSMWQIKEDKKYLFY